MEMLENLILIAHVIAALAIIGLVLLQQGKGAEMGSGFGGGSSSTVFGSMGAGNFLSRSTTIVGVLFFVTSFTLAYFAGAKTGIVRDLGIPSIETVIEADAARLNLDEVSLPEAEVGAEVSLPENDSTNVKDSELPEL